MERIKSPTKVKIKKERTKKGEVSVRDRKNGKEARVTLQLNIPGMENPRLAKYGATEEIARQRLAEAIVLTYIEIQKNKEFANIQIFSPECQIELNKFDEYMECVKRYQTQANGKKLEKNIVTNPLSEYVNKMLKEKKKQSEIVTVKRKKKISADTFSYYLRTAKRQILPYFGDVDVTTITSEKLQEHFDSLDYSEKYLKDIRLVFKLSLDVAVKEKIVTENVAAKIKIEKSISKTPGIEIEHLEQDRQEVWLDLFEKDKRQFAYLFEAILLTGARPEEGCRF
jgi:hypothetical protein